MLNKERDIVKELKEAGVNKLSISLNAPDKETYDEICKPMFPNAYESILDFENRFMEYRSYLERTSLSRTKRCRPVSMIPMISRISEMNTEQPASFNLLFHSSVRGNPMKAIPASVAVL